jgi:hypothetical protein
MTSKQLMSKAAFLETRVDLLETELQYLHEMLQKCGFPHGVKSLKVAVAELLKSREKGE